MGGKVMFGMDEREVLDQADYFINNRRDFNQAFDCLMGFVSRTGQDDDIDRISAHVWFKLALVLSLLDEQGMIPLHTEFARRAPGYSLVMEGDFMRDHALNLIRHGDTKSARRVLGDLEANRYHAGDCNREALIHMVRGRIYFEEGRLRQAEFALRRAFQTLPNIGRNAQWQYNIQFHWLMAAIAYSKRRQVKPWYGDFIKAEPSRKRRIAARMMYWLGRPGVWLVRQIGH